MVQSAKIVVMAPCKYAPCARGDRWFRCERVSENEVASYMCDPVSEWDSSVPSPKSIAWVRSEHPGMSLIYIS